MLYYSILPWSEAFLLSKVDFSKAPEGSGVYVFSEFDTPVTPNPQSPSRNHPHYERLMEDLRNMPCILYVGRAKCLRDRMRGYQFKPYLEIERRPKGSPPRHSADRHKGRALLHAQQFFDRPIFVRWAESADYITTEVALIRELHPVLNTLGIRLLEPE